MIDTRSVSVGYDGQAILEDLSFSIPGERISVILGPSGCGKSTLLKTLCGLIPPISGEILFDRQPVDYGSEEMMTGLYRRIGVLYQNSALLNSYDIYHNLALPLRMNHPDLQPEIEREMVAARLDQVGLSESAAKYPAELSGGMRKRASLARALIMDPEVVFCDEPSSGLDPMTASEIDSLIIDLNRLFRLTFVVVTHEVRSIRAIADHLIALHDGRMVTSQPFTDKNGITDRFVKRFLLEENNHGD